MIYIYGFILGLNLNFFFTKKNLFNYVFYILLVTFFVVYLFVDVITDNGFNRAFWYHIKVDIISGSYAPYLSLFLLNFFIISIFVFFGFILHKKIFNKRLNNKKYYKIIIVCLLLFNPALISSLKNFIHDKQIKKIDINFESHFHGVNNLGNNFIDKDIIIIIAESLERTYYSNTKLKDLNLKLLDRKNLIDFSNIIEVEDYTSWTIAGLVSLNCGLPLVDNIFYSNENCLSDYLKERNYNLTSIQGSNLNFAGNGDFYKIHNVDKVYGSTQIVNDYPGYQKSNWGIHDDLLFKFSKDQLLKLENKRENFAIWINTLDSHPPNGLLSANCDNMTKNIKDNLLKTVYCTDFYINNFINFAEKNDKENDNLYVIVSDHFLNPSNVEKKFLNEYEKRRNLFLIIDPQNNKKKIIKKLGSQIDVLPTLIDYLDGPNKINLGISLFNNDDKTLAEKFQDLRLVFLSIENKLKSLESEIDLKKLNIINNEDFAYLNKNYKVPIPVIIHNNSLLVVETNQNGKSKETILDIINKIYKKKNNNMNFESVVKCKNLEFYNINLKINCKYAYLAVSETLPEKNIKLKVIPFIQEKVDYFKISNEKYEKEMSKKDFLAISFSTLNKKSKLNKKLKKIKLKIINYFKSDFPNTYSFVYEKYNYYKIKNDKNRFKKKYNENKILKIKINNLLAHGGGAIDQLSKTNSLQALNENYDKGFRFFELDLALTSDQIIVAVHDWDNWKKNTDYKGKIPPSHEEFMSKKLHSKYDPLDENKILKWFIDRPDTVLVTDKLNDAIYISKKFDKIKNRVLIELFSQNEVTRAFEKEIDNILISQRILWQNDYSIEYLNKLYSKKIKPYGFAVDKNIVYRYPNFFLKAKNFNFKTYVYNINDKFLNESETDVLCNQFNFIEGVYSDHLNISNSNNIVECYN